MHIRILWWHADIWQMIRPLQISISFLKCTYNEDPLGYRIYRRFHVPSFFSSHLFQFRWYWHDYPKRTTYDTINSRFISTRTTNTLEQLNGLKHIILACSSGTLETPICNTPCLGRWISKGIRHPSKIGQVHYIVDSYPFPEVEWCFSSWTRTESTHLTRVSTTWPVGIRIIS
jgi:hypothetical protein